MSGFSPKTRALIHERAGGSCELCGRTISESTPRSIHHRRPRGMGGSKRPETNAAPNGLLLCGTANTPGSCHLWVESHRTSAISMGLLVPQQRLPAEVPVHLPIGWVLLDDAGNYLPTEGAA